MRVLLQGAERAMHRSTARLQEESLLMVSYDTIFLDRKVKGMPPSPSRELCGRSPLAGRLEGSSRRQAKLPFHWDEPLVKRGRIGHQSGQEAGKAAGVDKFVSSPRKRFQGHITALRTTQSLLG